MLILIMLANAAVFLAMMASTGVTDWSARTLLAWGGNLGELSLHGEWWRLWTATYLHAGFMHLVGNMLLLAMAGGVVQARIGQFPLLVAYTLCGLAGGLFSAFGSPQVVSVGASGAIAGIVGILVVLQASGRAPEVSGAWVAQIVVINGLYSFAPNVDWLAHLGGFLAGLLAGGVLAAMPARTQPEL